MLQLSLQTVFIWFDTNEVKNSTLNFSNMLLNLQKQLINTDKVYI